MKIIFLLVLLVVCCSALPFQNFPESCAMVADGSPTLKHALAPTMQMWCDLGKSVQLYFLSGDNGSKSKTDFYISIYHALNMTSIRKYVFLSRLHDLDAPMNIELYNQLLGHWQIFWIRSIKLLDELRKMNEPTENQDERFTRSHDNIIKEAILVRKHFRTLIIQAYPEYIQVDKKWPEITANTLQSYKEELTKNAESLRILERDTVLFSETSDELVSTTIAIIDQMEKFNDILAAEHSPILIASGLIIEQITVEEIVNRVVTAYRLLSRNLTETELDDYNEQLKNINRKSINDQIMTALTTITPAKLSIDGIINKMKESGEEIQAKMDEMNESPEIRQIAIEFEKVFSALAQILPKHENDNEAPNDKEFLQITDNEFVDQTQTLIRKGELFSHQKIDVNSIPVDMFIVIWRVQWEYVKSKYIKIQSSLLTSPAASKELIAYLNEEIKVFMMGDILVNLLIANFASKKAAITQQFYDKVIQDGANLRHDTEENVQLLEETVSLEISSSTGPTVPIEQIFELFRTRLGVAVNDLCERDTLQLLDLTQLRDQFRENKIILHKWNEWLTKQRESGKKRVFFLTMVKMIRTAYRCLTAISWHHDLKAYPGWTNAPAYQMYFTTISNEFSTICTAIISINHTSSDWKNADFSLVEAERVAINNVCDTILKDEDDSSYDMKTAYFDMLKAETYNSNNKYIVSISNWNKGFASLVKALSNLMDKFPKV